jgi:hypothetical protein
MRKILSVLALACVLVGAFGTARASVVDDTVDVALTADGATVDYGSDQALNAVDNVVAATVAPFKCDPVQLNWVKVGQQSVQPLGWLSSKEAYTVSGQCTRVVGTDPFAVQIGVDTERWNTSTKKWEVKNHYATEPFPSVPDTQAGYAVGFNAYGYDEFDSTTSLWQACAYYMLPLTTKPACTIITPVVPDLGL